MPPLVFLVGYVFTYQKVPGFPPVGSTNKIFYIAVFGALAGFVLDLAASQSLAARGTVAALRGVAWVVVPLAIALWIALPRLAAPDVSLWLSLAGLALGGIAMLWRLDVLAAARPSEGGEMIALALLAALAGGLAPIALFGGSSTSVGLCLGVAAGLALASLVGLFAPRGFGAAAILGGGGGLLAVIDTVTLITRRADPLALALLLSVLVSGQAGARLLLPAGRGAPRLRAVAIALMPAVPIALIVVLLFLREPNPLGT